MPGVEAGPGGPCPAPAPRPRCRPSTRELGGRLHLRDAAARCCPAVRRPGLQSCLKARGRRQLWGSGGRRRPRTGLHGAAWSIRAWFSEGREPISKAGPAGRACVSPRAWPSALPAPAPLAPTTRLCPSSHPSAARGRRPWAASSGTEGRSPLWRSAVSTRPGRRCWGGHRLLSPLEPSARAPGAAVVLGSSCTGVPGVPGVPVRDGLRDRACRAGCPQHAQATGRLSGSREARMRASRRSQEEPDTRTRNRARWL